MSVYAIGDLHLPGHEQKPMDVFGEQWDRHFDVIRDNWLSLVRREDIVLIPGDISWAMQLADALDDLRAIGALPGRKLLLRGNHDYWWSSIGKVRAALLPDMYAIQNDAIALDGHVFCGARGWLLPTAQTPLAPDDERIYQRELLRLEMSLVQGEKLGQKLVAMTHFPPLLGDGETTAFTELLERFPVTDVVYGHLHGAGIRNAYQGIRNGICYRLVSCDSIGFCPVRIKE